ncbi:hypothetical protein DL770_002992 [Monosporascus sp. CRB-9-2]|nr:hypothetical protein DL770_002992 [Monosporascus sp. CRB-9-2]
MHIQEHEEADETYIIAVCAFVEGISGGGLGLGRVRSLSQVILDKECSTCGQVTANYSSGNVLQLGRLKFDYKNSAICQPPCIDAGRDLRAPENATGGG